MALGLSWDPKSDTLKISGRTFVKAATRREMASQLASQFDPLGIVASLLLGGKLILQKVAASGVDWDDAAVSDEVKKDWKKWVKTSNILNEFCIPRNFFLEHTELRNDAEYQLHWFCDASDSAFSCAIYLRGVSAGKAQVSFVIGKSKLVLTHQQGWVISRKELEAAKMLSELMLVGGLGEIFRLYVLHVVFWHIFKVCGPNLNFSRCRNFLGDVITPKSKNSQKSNFQPFLSRFDAYTLIICPLLSCIVA